MVMTIFQHMLGENNFVETQSYQGQLCVSTIWIVWEIYFFVFPQMCCVQVCVSTKFQCATLCFHKVA